MSYDSQRRNKPLSIYEKLAFSNRPKTPVFSFTSLGEHDSDSVYKNIKKTASKINEKIVKRKAESFQKTANVGDIDLISQATGLISNKLGVDPQNSHDMVSKLMRDVDRIQQRFGGNPNSILNRLVDEMQNVMMQSPQSTTQNQYSELEKSRQNMALPMNAKQTEDFIKFELIKRVSVSSAEADRIAKSIVSEAKDLLLQMRPHTLDVISLAITALIDRYNDVTIVYGIRNNQRLIAELKQMLQQRG